MLRNKGILQSKWGRGRGYFVGREPEAISLGEVIRALNGPLAPVPCVSHTAYRKCDECEEELTCGIRTVMNDVRDATTAIFDRATLADVLHRIATLQRENKPPQPRRCMAWRFYSTCPIGFLV